MNFLLHNKNRLVGIALLCAAFGSSALTLGRLRGAALLGQPLDVVIAVQAGPDEDLAGLCFEAEVFYADARVDPSRVRLKVEPTVQAQGPTVRVSSSVKIDEPVVTVNLRAGCSQKTSRRYVVLAELASDVADLSPATTMPAPASPPVPVPGAAPRALAGPGVATSPTTQRSGRPPRRAPLAADAIAPVPNAGSARKLAARTQTGDAGNPGRGASRTTRSQSPGPRQNQTQAPRPDPSVKTATAHLKLDPADLLVTGDLGLRLSQQINVASIGNEKLRSEAIALWRAINANPVDILRDSQRVATLEGNIATLRTLTDKSQSTLADLTQRLQKAESDRSANKLVYLLAALAALALVAATYFWSRQRGKFSGAGDWWHSSNPAQDSVNQNPVAGGKPQANARVARVSTAPPPAGAAAETALGSAQSNDVNLEGLDLDLSVAGPLDSTQQTLPAHQPVPKITPRGVAATRPAAVASLPAVPPDSKGFAQSMGGALRAINTEELLDIRQQAEFFVSLGQHDQAVQILEARILEYADSSPLVYLDLLRIFHALNRRSEFRQCQQDFNRRFNGRANDFHKFADEGQDLMVYPAALTQLASLWPSEQALEFMEDCIFRSLDDDPGQSFDLAAFRDLLMLHTIARDLDAANSGPLASGHARLTRGPKVNADTVVSAVASAGLANANRSHTGLALDIDLDSPP